MPTSIVVDTDFLSSFLKIGRARLVCEFYGVSGIHLASAVRDELSAARLHPHVVGANWVVEHSVAESACEDLRVSLLPTRLGAGELASIVLAKLLPDSLLLISDSTARRAAEAEGVQCADVPAFLLACKRSESLSTGALQGIVDELRLKDYYAFRQNVLDLLLG